jgi:pimeloyl-ACP methyl ester carboxylesterase
VDQYTLKKLTDDVGALIDASGAKQVTLIAHDWGGAIAWAFAITKQRPLTRLVVMNLPHPRAFQRELKTWRQFKKSWYIYFFQLPWLPEKVLGRNNAKGIGRIFAKTSCNPENFGPEVRAIYSDAANRPGALNAMINYYRAIVRHRDSLNLGDGTVDVPTLLIWGEQDVALDVSGTQGTEKWVPDFTLKRLPNASHWVQQDAPAEVNMILKEWLPRV